MIYKVKPSKFSPHFTISNCVFEYEGKILLLKRQPWETDPGAWCIPGGGIEKKETPKDTVVREIREETGIVLEEGRFLFLGQLFVRREDMDLEINMFYMPVSKLPKVNPNKDEHSAFKWVTIEEAKTLPLLRDGEKELDLFLELKERVKSSK